MMSSMRLPLLLLLIIFSSPCAVFTKHHEQQQKDNGLEKVLFSFGAQQPKKVVFFVTRTQDDDEQGSLRWAITEALHWWYTYGDRFKALSSKTFGPVEVPPQAQFLQKSTPDFLTLKNDDGSPESVEIAYETLIIVAPSVSFTEAAVRSDAAVQINLTKPLPIIDRRLKITAGKSFEHRVIINGGGAIADGIVFSGNQASYASMHDLVLGGFNRAVVIEKEAVGVIIKNNYIGSLEVASTAVLSNTIGIYSDDCTSPVISNCVISGNSEYGVFGNNSASVLCRDNFIGTDVTGHKAVPNGYGFFQSGGVGTLFLANVVSGNAKEGVYCIECPGMRLDNNRIGTTVDGMTALKNGNTGAIFHSCDGLRVANTIFSANAGCGLQLIYCSDAAVQDCFIGVGLDGQTALGNEKDGIYLDSTTSVLIGNDKQHPNVISGNRGYGLDLHNAIGNTIIHNYIGLALDGSTAVPNAGGTILFRGNSTDTNNHIAYNTTA